MSVECCAWSCWWYIDILGVCGLIGSTWIVPYLTGIPISCIWWSIAWESSSKVEPTSLAMENRDQRCFLKKTLTSNFEIGVAKRETDALLQVDRFQQQNERLKHYDSFTNNMYCQELSRVNNSPGWVSGRVCCGISSQTTIHWWDWPLAMALETFFIFFGVFFFLN